VVSRVDFYILKASGDLARQQFACRLAEKAYRLDNRVHIHVANRDDVQKMDDLLWTFRDGSFVPHEVFGLSADNPPAPVTIGCEDIPSAKCDLLINLGDAVPATVSSFPRVAEVVTSDDECKARSRQRFVEYRDQGHTLETHNL
jgi:DNA polymerase-3 subunit chi